jgi:response regulator RpfG family c-di-GMP phosphodiesterase
VDAGDRAGYFTDCVGVSAYFHDVGKERTLYSMSNSQEFLDRLYKSASIEVVLLEKIRQHVQAGARMANQRLVSSMILHHHEEFGGEGFPQGLSGEAIPLGARIIFPCVALTAIINWRSYDVEHPGWFGIEELKRCSGRDYDRQKMITHLQQEAYPKAMVGLNKRKITQEIGQAHFRDEEKYFQKRYLLDKPEEAVKRYSAREQFDPTVVDALIEEMRLELRTLG